MLSFYSCWVQVNADSPLMCGKVINSQPAVSPMRVLHMHNMLTVEVTTPYEDRTPGGEYVIVLSIYWMYANLL